MHQEYGHVIMSSDASTLSSESRGHKNVEGHDESSVQHLIQDEESASIADLRDDDVLLGRGKSHLKHPGNLRFEGKVETPWR